MKSLSRGRVTTRDGGRLRPDGPGLVVDASRAGVRPLRDRAWQGAAERGQAGLSAKRSAGQAGGGRWAGVGELSREPHVGEYRVDDLGGLR